MSEGKERSGIFKFFYFIISIITFPIFAVLFVLRHPFWILFILLLIVGGAAYYPISQGVKPDDVLTWYQTKFVDAKKEVVAKAAEKGVTDFVPQALLDDVKNIEEEEAEALLPKGENYNRKVVRDSKTEETKAKLKQRSGFKKKGADDETQVKNEEEVSDAKTEEQAIEQEKTEEVDVLEKNGEQVGGLSSFLKTIKEPVEEVEEEPSEEEVTATDAEQKDVVAEEKTEVESQDEDIDDIMGLDDEEEAKPVVKEPVEVKEEKPVQPVEPQKKATEEDDDDMELDFF